MTDNRTQSELAADGAKAVTLSPGHCPPERVPNPGPRVDVSGAQLSTAGLPTEAAARKHIPLYSGLIRYFPHALQAVAELSWIGNQQHNPGQRLHWDRSKSQDEHDALCRHLWEAGTVDIDGVRHSTKVAWRALAALEKELEAAHGQARQG